LWLFELEFTMTKTILVTGGAGYIGSHACKALAEKGYLPVSYDNLSRGNRWAVKWGPLQQGDISDRAALRAVFERYHPVAVIHFAAFAYVGESVKDPLLYYRNNVCGTLSLLESLLEHACLPIVFSSTCATYGLPEKLPISEEHPQNPINPYGFSKLAVERMLRDLNQVRGLPSVSLRYFNAAGADPRAEIGEVHVPETHLIPLVIQAARDDTPVQIFGTDYATPDGTCIRDYIHVSDLADAHVRALEYLLAGGTTCALNLANTRGYSVKEVIATAERVCGRRVRANAAPRRSGDPPMLVGDATKARTLLNWRPVRSDLQTQVSDAWTFLQALQRTTTEHI
jgi:UDP-glucose-4-epimerase GalE